MAVSVKSKSGSCAAQLAVTAVTGDKTMMRLESPGERGSRRLAVRTNNLIAQRIKQGISMSSKHLLDPQLHFLADFFPPGFVFSEDMLPDFREQRSAELVMGDAEASGVQRTEIQAPGPDGGVRCLVYIPENVNGSAYLHIHGGGYIIGTADGSDQNNIDVASQLGTVVVSVDYRLAPEVSIPGPLEDCYAALAWLHDNASELGVDRTRIAVGGESAGGGLAAALAILARDRGQYAICHQHLTYPMLDNLTGASGFEGDPMVGEFVWTREHNQFGWKSFLGDAEPVAPQVPARLESYEGLPSTWIFTGALDLFRDENIAYAQNLLKAGVPTDFVLYAGACHAFQMIPGAKLGERFKTDYIVGLAQGLGV
jgi:acetyl esterase/lipase